MAKEFCSCCLLDAIFTSSDSQFKACPKHYFSGQTQGYKLERRKIPINNESKVILLLFIVTLKWKFKAWTDKLIEESSENDKLEWLNEAFNYCDRITLSLERREFVWAKLILSPFEYFLTQPKEKTQQYIEQNWNRVDLLEFRQSVKAHVFDFNYFRFEDKKYIHGWAYKSSYNQDRLSDFCHILFFEFIKISEYEMAYELCQNLLSYLEFYDHPSIKKFKNMSDLFGDILQKIIKKEGYSQQYEQWKTMAYNDFQKLTNDCLHIVPGSVSIEEPTADSSQNLYILSYVILDRVIYMMSMNSNISEYYFNSLRYVECLNKYYSKNVANRISHELGLLYYVKKSYDEAKECIIKSSIYHKERVQDHSSWQSKVGLWDGSLEYLIEDYRCLAKVYGAQKNYDMIKVVLNAIELNCSSTKDKFLYYAAIGEMHYLFNDFDEAFKNIWKCTKMSKQQNFVISYELSNLWLYLADIHVWKCDFKKAHQFLYYANSLLSILPKEDPNQQEIYKAFGVFYLNSQRYEEAVKYFELITNRWSDHELLFAQLSMGIAYFWMLNIEKAWKFLTEAKKLMSGFPESYKNQLFIVNAYIGELYYLDGNLKEADEYFNQAFDLIDHYDIFKIDIFLKSSSFVFSYFYGKSSYKKCEIILLRINKILKNRNHLKFRMPYYFILKAELHIALNKANEAERYLSKAEKLLNGCEILWSSQKKLKINDLDCISDHIELAKIYINLFNISDGRYQKAEKYLKYAKEIVKEKRRNDHFSKLATYYWLGVLYLKELREKKSRHYLQRTLWFASEFKK